MARFQVWVHRAARHDRFDSRYRTLQEAQARCRSLSRTLPNGAFAYIVEAGS